ncbi:MAG: bile acid:sodium symporter family protein [Gemmataceae bacterium]
MLEFVRKRWFLLGIIVGVVLAWFAPEALVWTLPITPQLVIGPGLFLMAWTLPTDDLRGALSRPWPGLWATFLSFTVVPGLASVSGLFSFVPDDVAVGLLIIASGPCTLASVVIWTRMADGNEATALLVIVWTSCVSVGATSAWLAWTTSTSVELSAWDMALKLFQAMLVPMGLGQLFRLYKPAARFATDHKKLLSSIAQLSILLIVWKACADMGTRFQQAPEDISVVLLVTAVGMPVGVHLATLFVGLLTSQVLGFAHKDQIAIAFASSQKTLPVALLLFGTFYRGTHPLAVLPIAFYHFGQLIVDTVIAERLRKHKPTGEPDAN